VEEDAPEQYAAYAGRLWEDGPLGEAVSWPPEQPPPSAAPARLTLTTPFVMEFVRVPAGPFLLGSDPMKDKDAQDDEQPQHSLDLPEFYIGKYPVTNAQFAAFLRAAGHKAADDKWQSGQFPQGGTTHPATFLSWHDAVAFCRWFSQASGHLVRLPTEAEWEKAARGTDGRIYPWGNQPPTAELCNFSQNVGSTTPVGSYSPQGDSPYEAADMAGNVWEWCSTLWVEQAYPFFVQDEWREDYLKGKGGRVLRGGSWNDDPDDVRCAVRNWYDLVDWDYNWGCRVVVSPI
jgi:formylglycine-generating enzyme required for sulfatase activity